MTKSPPTSLPSRLARRFSPRLIRLGVDGPRRLEGGGAGGTIVLVGRELSLFLRVEADAVPVKQRPGFVALEVRRAAPFADADHDVLWFGNRAAVWYWSRSRVQALLGATPGKMRLRSEAVYRGEALDDDAVELLALQVPVADGDPFVAGYEARLWRRGYITASRWWQNPPSPTQWQAFLRGGGTDPNRPLPEPSSALVRAQPLNGGFQPQALTSQLQAHLPLLAGVVASLVLALMAWQLAGVARIGYEIRGVEERTRPLERQLEAVINARARSDSASATISELLALRPASSQTQLMAEVARATPGSGWKITTWHQPGPDTLEVTFKGTDLDTAAIVTAWEQSSLLEEVSPATGSRMDELVLVAQLTPLAAQTDPAP